MLRRLLPFAMTSVLLGCHAQGAGARMSGEAPPLEHDLLESSLKPWVNDLSACLVDHDIVPGQRTNEKAHLQLSINDSGQVQSVTVQVDDPDMTECITRRANDWVFPRGSSTIASVELKIASKTAEIGSVAVLPATRTATR